MNQITTVDTYSPRNPVFRWRSSGLSCHAILEVVINISEGPTASDWVKMALKIKGDRQPCQLL